jgi:hypothetical protein
MAVHGAKRNAVPEAKRIKLKAPESNQKFSHAMKTAKENQ